MERFRPNEQGFGLVELLIAMTVLSVGVVAVAAAFTSGMITLRRANAIATATAIADAQMERYRAVRYTDVALHDATVPPTGDLYWSGFTGALQTTSTCLVETACNASQTLTGADTPDGNAYRVDTYITLEEPVSTPAIDSDEVKVVRVVVRAGGSAKTLARIESTFHASTGR